MTINFYRNSSFILKLRMSLVLLDHFIVVCIYTCQAAVFILLHGPLKEADFRQVGLDVGKKVFCDGTEW